MTVRTPGLVPNALHKDDRDYNLVFALNVPH
jgi:hypothetical protein